MARGFLRRLLDPRQHLRDFRKHVVRPVQRLFKPPQEQAVEDTAAVEEAARQEQDAARQAADHASNLQAQQAILNANMRAEDAIAKAQERAPIDRLDVVLGDSSSSQGFRFRNAAAGVAGDAATFARKARAWLRR